MTKKRYKVAWHYAVDEIIARDMRLDDALIFIKALCERYDDRYDVHISLMDNNEPEEGENNA